MKTIEDAILKDVNLFKKTKPHLGDKETILEAIATNDLQKMKEISNFFYNVSGIYSRLCRYAAFLYRYDWLVTPYIYSEAAGSKTIEVDFYKVLDFLDDFNPKKFFNEVALKAVIDGSYYGYKIWDNGKLIIQELPNEYCRTIFYTDGNPVVEFNMKYFDDKFADVVRREKILSVFPKEFQEGYRLYKTGKLYREGIILDGQGWYVLEPKNTFKFNPSPNDMPIFISVIPAIIDLDEAQNLDKKKMQQQLLKIIIQKIALDKDGFSTLDAGEIKELHNNAVRMLGRAIGIDVLTTFADVQVADLSDKNTTTTKDDLEKVERTVYNESGMSHMLFNTDGNVALEKSILNDEAFMYTLVSQFNEFLNKIISKFNEKTKKYKFKVELLTTTIYNYKELAKQFKEHATFGYSKMLPQIALGQSQSSILFTAKFENDILNLSSLFIPLMSSNTINSENLRNGGSNNNTAQTAQEKKAGRPEKEDDEKSTKTLKNIESKG